MGGGTGGSVGMAETPKFMGMGIQGAMAESQIEVNKASAEKMKAEAIKIAGVDTDLGKSQIANLNANTGNTEADRAGTFVRREGNRPRRRRLHGSIREQGRPESLRRCSGQR